MHFLPKWIRRKLAKKDFLNKNIVKSAILEIAYKKIELEKKKDHITGIVLGSSHGAYGFDTGAAPIGYFNLCSTSQDLYYSYHLFLHLKNLLQCYQVILFFSVFTNGYEVQHTGEKHIAAYYKTMYAIEPKYESDTELDEQAMLCDKYINLNTIKMYNTWGYHHPKAYLVSAGSEDRTRPHLRENRRQNDQFAYFEKLCEEVVKNGKKFIVVIPPATKEYRSGLPPKEELFSKLNSYAIKHQITVLDFFDSDIFETDDFGDFDHLTPSGAQKLTGAIIQQISG